MLAFSNLILAQDDNFGKLVSRIDNYMLKNQWDEIVVLAPDLLIENPAKGDGYYYTAYAFFKMNQPDVALKYIAKAEKLADDALTKKINDLKNAMSSDKQLDASVKDAEQLEKDGKTGMSADAWNRIWLSRKVHLDYALNAVRLYIDLKKYQDALAILNDPMVSSDSEAQKLIQKLNATPQMTSINSYEAAMKSGLSFMDQKEYPSAILKFNNALHFRPNDPKATENKNIAIDETAWEKAKKTNTIGSFEEYQAGKTIKTHDKEAESIIKRSLIYHGEKAANDNDFVNMESNLKKYISRYPFGEDVGKAKGIMCDAYYRTGIGYAKNKTSGGQTDALAYFEKAKQICVDKKDLAGQIHTAERLLIRYRRPDRFFYAFIHDSISKYGISVGSINNPDIGGYFSVRFNTEVFTSSTYFTVNNAGVTDGNTYADVRFKNEIRRGNGEALLGITAKVTHPFWIYVGAGISGNPVFWKMDTYDDNGDYYKTDWVRNTDEVMWKIVCETGLIMDLSGFNLRVGYKTTNFSGGLITFGIGFSVSR